MISDDERREIAARLRELADANEGCLGMDRVNRVLRDGQAILGTSGLASVADVLRRYADLIEPDERTCRMTKKGPEFVLAGWWECSECGPYIRRATTRLPYGHYRNAPDAERR